MDLFSLSKYTDSIIGLTTQTWVVTVALWSSISKLWVGMDLIISGLPWTSSGDNDHMLCTRVSAPLRVVKYRTFFVL